MPAKLFMLRLSSHAGRQYCFFCVAVCGPVSSPFFKLGRAASMGGPSPTNENDGPTVRPPARLPTDQRVAREELSSLVRLNTPGHTRARLLPYPRNDGFSWIKPVSRPPPMCAGFLSAHTCITKAGRGRRRPSPLPPSFSPVRILLREGERRKVGEWK